MEITRVYFKYCILEVLVLYLSINMIVNIMQIQNSYLLIVTLQSVGVLDCDWLLYA